MAGALTAARTATSDSPLNRRRATALEMQRDKAPTIGSTVVQSSQEAHISQAERPYNEV
jgi:hypothetical protein